MKENNNQYAIPGAIIIAGLLIAGAVIFNGGGVGSRVVDDGNDPAAQLITPIEAAKAVGVDKKDFESCLSSGSATEKVNEDLASFAETGLSQGTPASLIVKKGLDGAMIVIGAHDVSSLASAIDMMLSDDTSLEFNPQAGIGYTDAISIDLTDSDHLFGNPDAAVTIVEYSDLECPFCKRFHPTVQSVLEQYDGQVSWVYRHLPLESIHPQARPLAEGSECVAELGGNDAFWNYIDLVFSS